MPDYIPGVDAAGSCVNPFSRVALDNFFTYAGANLAGLGSVAGEMRQT